MKWFECDRQYVQAKQKKRVSVMEEYDGHNSTYLVWSPETKDYLARHLERTRILPWARWTFKALGSWLSCLWLQRQHKSNQQNEWRSSDTKATEPAAYLDSKTRASTSNNTSRTQNTTLETHRCGNWSKADQSQGEQAYHAHQPEASGRISTSQGTVSQREQQTDISNAGNRI
jgi:hypothetical protein